MICFHILNNFQQQKTSSQGKETFYAFINYLCPYMSKILIMIKKMPLTQIYSIVYWHVYSVFFQCIYLFLYLFITSNHKRTKVRWISWGLFFKDLSYIIKRSFMTSNKLTNKPITKLYPNNHLTYREALTVLCSVVKHAGSS